VRAALPGYGRIDTIVCDIDGVLLLGSAAIPGARVALEQIRAADIRLIFATNNATKPPPEVRKHVREVVGFDPGPNSVVTSGVATARFIAGQVNRVYVLGSDGLRQTLGEAGITITDDWREADAVVTGTDFNVTYKLLADAGLAVQNGATFYATNSDVSFPRPDGLHPGAGAITAVVALTTGVSPIVCGKPFPPMRDTLEDLGGAGILVVGDRPDTDIALGKEEGWATVLVLSGVVSNPEQIPAALTPDVVLSSIADLPIALGIGSGD
jgi:HAD superfamily hydrolase (TIGR01450 family)